MNILLAGGANSLMDTIIDKLNKEGHRIYVLTGDTYKSFKYKKIFERYDFAYDDDCLREILDSIRPEVIIFMGAFDPNFGWGGNAKKEAVRFISGLTNLLMSFSQMDGGRFIFLSTHEVFEGNHQEDILEDEAPASGSFRAMALIQGEQMCQNYVQLERDVVVLRLDHVYTMPQKLEDVWDICTHMCLSAMRTGKIQARENYYFSLLYVSDAVEYIYQIVKCHRHRCNIYHLSSSDPINEMELAKLVRSRFQDEEEIEIIDKTTGNSCRLILSNQAYDAEFKARIFHEKEETVADVVDEMRRHSDVFLQQDTGKKTIWERFLGRAGSIFQALIPFIENLVCFIPFFMLNNRAVGSDYFTNLDFYLLYVLLFAIVHGQQQATFSAILAVAGYCFRQMYNRSGFEVLLDYNTYVWIAQLFILGLVVGYMRDQLSLIRSEGKREITYLSGQVQDIRDINDSNTRMKDILEIQIVNQNDSFGKIYEITSSLDKYAPEEVLFYAVEVVSRLMDSKDISIYNVANGDYARLFSATSEKAKMMGNSIKYTNFGEMYDALSEKRVYINKALDEQYPLMANAIYSEDDMQLILMVWGIPWERMTLGQANLLVIIGYLIQNAVVRANRYLEALENRRYIEGTDMLEPDAFSSLVRAYLEARSKGLTECTFLNVPVEQNHQEEAGKILGKKLRQTDYMGKLADGELYVLLANTSNKDAAYVVERFAQAGYECQIREDIGV